MSTDMTLSFAHGNGDLDHNARRKNGNPRTCGIRNRKAWNENIIELDVDDVLEQQFGNALGRYNEKQLAGRHPERVKTMAQWVNAQRRGGRAYTEYVIQLGNKLTGCTYEYVTNEKGEMLAENGSVIMPWQTQKTPKAKLRDGKYLIPSHMQKRLKKFYRDCVKRFQQVNPNMIVVGAFIHCDEKGGVHLHLDVVCVCKQRNGIGLGMGVNGCVRETLDKLGITYGTTRKNNAQKSWTTLMRKEFATLAVEHDFNIVDGNCKGRKHKTTEKFIEEENIRNEYLDKKHEALMQKEAELNKAESMLKKQRAELQKRIDKLEHDSSVIQAQVQANVQREEWLDEREEAIRETARVQAEHGQKLTDIRAQLDKRESKLRMRENNVGIDEQAASQMMRTANERYELAENLLKEADAKDAAAVAREKELNGYKDQLATMKWIVERVQAEHPEWLSDIKYKRSNVRERGGHGRV